MDSCIHKVHVFRCMGPIYGVSAYLMPMFVCTLRRIPYQGRDMMNCYLKHVDDKDLDAIAIAVVQVRT